MKNLKDYIIVLLSIILLFVGFYFPNKILELKQNMSTKMDLTKRNQLLLSVFDNNFSFYNNMNGIIMTDILCQNASKDIIPLSSLVQTKPILCFRYADINCNSCVDIYFDDIKQVFANDTTNIIVLSSYKTERDFHVFKRFNRLQNKLLQIDYGVIKWKIEEQNTPYYFVLYPNMQISDFYIPSKSFSEMNCLYLEGIKRLLTNYVNIYEVVAKQ